MWIVVARRAKYIRVSRSRFAVVLVGENVNKGSTPWPPGIKTQESSAILLTDASQDVEKGVGTC